MSDEVWELESGGGDRLFAREWPWRISCQTRPASIEVRAAPTDTGATELRLDASVRGFGPVPARHLANHLRGLELRIRRQAAAAVLGHSDRVRGRPKLANTLVSGKPVIPPTRSPDRVSTIRP
jgi:hypothetical protein